MRGRQEPQVTMLAFVDLEERVPGRSPAPRHQGLGPHIATKPFLPQPARCRLRRSIASNPRPR